MRYLVLGAGRQGLAIAFDLAKCGEAASITLVDADPERLERGARRLRRLVRVPLETVARRLRGRGAAGLMRRHDAVVSALPYRFNPALARAAVQAGTGFCDLGGNTALVREELKLDGAARKAGIALVPDCGLAPGLANLLAGAGVREVGDARHVRIRCGGLPVEPRPPLGYSLLFSLEGLTNEYTGEAVVLRGGRLARVPAFTGVECFRGPPSLGSLEAFHTSGGSSTAPWTFRGRLQGYEYKTVRYAGHFEKVRALIDLGLLDERPVRVGRARVSPREVFHAVAGPRLEAHRVRDLALLRVDVTAVAGAGVRYALLEYFDERTGFSAMERTTGFPAAAIAHSVARGEIPPGATTPERIGLDPVLGPAQLRALRERGLHIRRKRLHARDN